LRVEKYSPLKDQVATYPGYYIGDDTIVYSELLGRQGLKRISRQIRSKFYTSGQVWRAATKLFRIGVLDSRDIPTLVLSAGVLIGQAVSRSVNKAVRRPLLRYSAAAGK